VLGDGSAYGSRAAWLATRLDRPWLTSHGVLDAAR